MRVRCAYRQEALRSERIRVWPQLRVVVCGVDGQKQAGAWEAIT